MEEKRERKKIKLSEIQKRVFKGAGCPDCGCRMSSVNDTGEKDYGNLRWRECRNCGRKYRTVETTI